MAGMRVLVTGVDGYIGAVLGPRLLEHGFDAVGIDCGFYRDGWLYNDDHPRTADLHEGRAAAGGEQSLDAVDIVRCPLGPSAGVPDGSTCIFLSTLGTSNPTRGARLDRARSSAPKRKGTVTRRAR
jgi:NAD(P)-dependent dehydrogenase (short-subunit alcohol dehydrogenase family)